LRVDPTFNRAEHLPFGLLERGVGALALAADGIWAGGLGTPGERNGLVFASSDLQRWRWVDGPSSRPFAGARVNALGVRGRIAWVGTTRGLLRVDLDDDTRVDRWDASDGLPSDAVTSIAAGTTGVWVGTSAGLAFADRSPHAIGPRVAVHHLILWGDTLWIASEIGVLALASPDSVPRRLSMIDARLGRDVSAVARADSVLAIATSTDLIEIDLRLQRVLPPRAAAFGSLHHIAHVTMDARTIWLVGEGGVLALHRASGRSAMLPVGITLAAPPTSVVLATDAAWIGTRDGLVRVRRRVDGMPP
jgi:ligand-binding sensor domain-containing protein